ncbi:TPA: hypothetical protein U2J54_000723 [Providencia rettgeri]|nr:hypothetical protein [Providencia rettgeri]HEM8267421.1 hypothetical protein [Providencia rettgeri]
MEWLTRMALGLPPRAEDVKKLKEIAPELFSSEKYHSAEKFLFPPYYYSSEELRELISIWLKKIEQSDVDTPPKDTCSYPHCIRKVDTSNGGDCIEMMTIAGGKAQNPPAKSFFNLIDSTKLKNSVVQRVILTDPYIYSDIGQHGEIGGFNNLLELLEHLNILSDTKFTLELTPQNDSDKITRFENSIKKKFSNCTVSNHRNDSKFHDRFILVQYTDETSIAWYGPSLNGLNSSSIVIFGDLTDNNALSKLTKLLL